MTFSFLLIILLNDILHLNSVILFQNNISAYILPFHCCEIIKTMKRRPCTGYTYLSWNSSWPNRATFMPVTHQPCIIYNNTIPDLDFYRLPIVLLWIHIPLRKWWAFSFDTYRSIYSECGGLHNPMKSLCTTCLTKQYKYKRLTDTQVICFYVYSIPWKDIQNQS